jgi:hypothetical protein
MAAAERGEDRDSKVEHWRKALSYRPNDPRNLPIEYRIGVELSQTVDPVHQEGPRPREALPVFMHILQQYKHMEYYTGEMVNRSESPELMVPGAAIHAASLERGLNRDSTKARELVVLAMEMLEQTYRGRVEDWTKKGAPPRPRDDDPEAGPMEISKWKSRLHFWEERKKRAADGEVFGELEMALVRAAVRQFGYSFGPQKPHEVPVVMAQVVKMFPGTPMARVAEEHIKRAAGMTEKEVFEELPKGLEDMHSPFESGGAGDAGSPPKGTVLTPNGAESPPAGGPPRVTAWSGERGVYWVVGAIAVGLFVLAAVYVLRSRARRTSR